MKKSIKVYKNNNWINLSNSYVFSNGRWIKLQSNHKLYFECENKLKCQYLDESINIDSSIPVSSIPDSIIPVSSVPDPTTPVSSIPDSSVPDSSIPTSSIPTSSIPDSSVPVSSIPDSSIPTSSIPTSSIPTSSIPDSSVPVSSIPDSSIPDSSIPTSSIPDSSVPVSSIPDSSIPDSSIPDSSIPTSSIPTSSIPTSSKGGGNEFVTIEIIPKIRKTGPLTILDSHEEAIDGGADTIIKYYLCSWNKFNGKKIYYNEIEEIEFYDYCKYYLDEEYRNTLEEAFYNISSEISKEVKNIEWVESDGFLGISPATTITIKEGEKATIKNWAFTGYSGSPSQCFGAIKISLNDGLNEKSTVELNINGNSFNVSDGETLDFDLLKEIFPFGDLPGPEGGECLPIEGETRPEFIWPTISLPNDNDFYPYGEIGKKMDVDISVVKINKN